MITLIKKMIPKGIKQSIKQTIGELIAKSPTGAQAVDANTALEQAFFFLQEKNLIPPIPPKHLQIRVSSAYYGHFFNHGKIMINDMETALHKLGYSINQFNHILDFGCGCGRILIPLSMTLDNKKLNGTDIDPEAINWLKLNYPGFNDLETNGIQPPTKYREQQFDFIFSISIFTHLPEEMHMNWIKELSRIMQPGGIGIFSIHGEFYYHLISEADRKELLEKGFKYTVGLNTDGLPDFYQSAFHTHEYIHREWGKYFEVIDIVKQGIAGGQDAVIVRKR